MSKRTKPKTCFCTLFTKPKSQDQNSAKIENLARYLL
jgi:ferredoxin-thioredoxin reductase catalytic subunit